jgi:hypothetical protein
MPTLGGPQHIAHRPPGGPFPPTSPRPDFAQHFFAGGNSLMPALLAGTDAEHRRDLLAASARASLQLQKALTLELTSRRQDNRLTVDVRVTNLAGHKLPTGFPSRRLWLHLRATDAGGRVVFESGAYDNDGRIAAGETPQPHQRTISTPAQTQIFESEARDQSDSPTLSLLASATHAKDNRILPAGFSLNRLTAAGLPAYDIGPAGADTDPDFRPGSSLTTYLIPTPGPVQIEVEVLFQTIKPSHELPALSVPRQLKTPQRVAAARTQAP